MKEDHIIVDNTGFVVSWVSSFTSLDEFKESVSTCSWLKPETLETAYNIVKGTSPTTTEVTTAKKKKD